LSLAEDGHFSALRGGGKAPEINARLRVVFEKCVDASLEVFVPFVEELKGLHILL